MKTLRIYISLFAVCFFLGSCAYNPVTGKKEVSFMSPAQELALGKQSDPSIIQNFGVYDDPTLQSFLTEKGNEMVKVSHTPDAQFTFRVLDSPVVNAFAVPGGYVYFTRGILAHFNNEAEFAGVLGHEIGHVTARHSAKQYTKQVLGQVGLIAGMVLSEGFRQYAGEASQALQLMFLKFGRDDESQSDKLGVEYSTKVGYDAKHMANFFNTLSRMSEGQGGRVPTFMSTHPDPADRFQKVGQMASEWQAKEPGKSYTVNRDSYLKMIDGIMYGEDPQQGYVENSVFYHPQMKFQYNVPTGWRTVNSPVQVQMGEPNGKAMMLLTLGKGASLKEAGQNFINDNKLTLVDSRNVRVNDFQALALISDQYPQQQGQQVAGSAAAPTNSMTSKGDAKSTSTSSGGNAPRKGGTVNTSPSNTQTKDLPSKTPTKTTPTNTNNTPGNNNSPGNTRPAPTNSSGQQPDLRIMTYLIQDGDVIYMMHGLAKYPDFASFERTFASSMNSFKRLRDASKINVKAYKLKIQPVKRDGTLQQALQSYNQPQSKMKDLALLNGLKLDERVTRGSKIKTLVK